MIATVMRPDSPKTSAKFWHRDPVIKVGATLAIVGMLLTKAGQTLIRKASER